ncbi:MAG: glycosyltransferase family 2 protein [Candidatus Acidiferrales bacterium]
MSNPTVSVIIDTYNHERFIEDAIRSALDQDFPRSQMEILVVDDGSTDRTPEIVRKFEPQVRLLRKLNGGQASAFNFGIEHARGELVAFLDGDDVWLPDKLSRVVAEFERDPAEVMVYHQFSFWDSRSGKQWEGDHRNISGDILADRRKLLRYQAAPTSSLVFRRAALERLLPVPSDLTFMADAYLVHTAIFLGSVGFLSECLARNRVHGGNLWFTESAKPNEAVLRRRIEVRELAIQGVLKWVQSNVPIASHPSAGTLFRLWRLVQDVDKFRLMPPSRFREFVHLCRHALLEAPIVSRGELAYRWMYAFAFLIVGKHAHYLAGVRTRVRKLKRRLQGRVNPERAGESAGHVS